MVVLVAAGITLCPVPLLGSVHASKESHQVLLDYRLCMLHGSVREWNQNSSVTWLQVRLNATLCASIGLSVLPLVIL
jgi:hypothetical protein